MVHISFYFPENVITLIFMCLDSFIIRLFCLDQKTNSLNMPQHVSLFGYHYGHKVYDLHTHKSFISKDVWFYEHISHTSISNFHLTHHLLSLQLYPYLYLFLTMTPLNMFQTLPPNTKTNYHHTQII